MIVEHGSRRVAMAPGAGEQPGAALGLHQMSSNTYHQAAVDAVAGAVAGAVARTVVSPLDVIKIRFQVQLEPTSRLARPSPRFSGPSKYNGIVQAAREIFREEGMIGLWRGNVPALMLVVPYTAIQFVVVQNFKSHVARYSKGAAEEVKLSPCVSFAGGAIAGCAATIGSYPCDLLRTILASQGLPKVYLNLRSAFRGVVQTRGWKGLYAGLTASLVEIVPYAGLQFGVYDSLKHFMTTRKEGKEVACEDVQLSNWEHFLCGLVAGIIPKTVCHPLDVVKKRFQMGGLARDAMYGERIHERTYRNVWDALKKIVASEGGVGLYKGIVPSVVKAAPTAAITFVVYELVSERLQRSLNVGR